MVILKKHVVNPYIADSQRRKSRYQTEDDTRRIRNSERQVSLLFE